jgi:hypothetical protein
MELKDIPVLNTRNIGFNFFGSLVVPQDAVMELNRCPIADIKVYEGLMYSRICHGFNDILVIDLKELVRMYVYLRANKKEVIQVLGYLIDHGIVYERPGAGPIRYSELWHGSPVGVYIASALYEQERYKIFGPEERPIKGESEEKADGTEENG